MDGPRDCHTEWRQAERERQMSYDIIYMWGIKNGIIKLLYKTQCHRCRKQTYGYQEEKVVKLGDSVWHTYTTMYKTDKAISIYCTAQGTLLNIL